MRAFIAFFFAIVAGYGFIVMVEAGMFTDIAAHLKTSTSLGAGKSPWPAFMILLATGIIGILGIRRGRKKS